MNGGQHGNTDTKKMIAEFGDILRRKKRTVRHIEQAIARYHERQWQHDSAVRFNRQEVGQK